MNLIKKITLLSYISVASAESAMLTPAFPQIQQIFHISNAQLSGLMSLFLLGYLLCQLFFGPLANRFGRLQLMRIGFFINVLGILIAILGGVTHHYEILLMSRLITALGAGVGLSGTFTLIHEWMNESEAKSALSMAVLSFMLGIGVGIYLGSVMVQYCGWLSVLYVMLVYAVLILASTWLFQPSAFTPQSIHLKTILRGYAHSLNNLKLLRYSYILGFFSAVSYLYSAAAPLISEGFLHLQSSQYGLWNLLIMVGMLLGSLHGKRLARRYSMSVLLKTGLLGTLFCILIWAVMWHFECSSALLFFMVAMGVYYFGGFVFASASFLAMEGAVDKSGASGMMNFINMGTATLALVCFGYLPYVWFASFLVVLGVGLLLAFIMILLPLCRMRS